MRAQVTMKVVAAAMTVLLGFVAGCGDNDNNDNRGGTPRTRTPTPAQTAGRTATPGAPTAVPTAAGPTSTPSGTGGTATVTFTGNATATLQGFTIKVTYPTAKGSFHGSADQVACTSNAPNFTPNDKDNGEMLLVSATTSSITFPQTITCTFDTTAGQSLSAGDIQATVTEVTQNGTQGDTSLLTVSTSVS